MDKKTNYSVARVETYTKTSITKVERHNERKNKSYSNMNVDLTQTPNNVHYKRCETTYNEKLKEFINNLKATNPQTLAETLVEKAVENSGGSAGDDMTVLVAKIFEKA